MNSKIFLNSMNHKPNYEIKTSPLSKAIYLLELKNILDFWQSMPIATCRLMFGFPLGNEYYNDLENWEYEVLEVDRVVTHIEKISKKYSLNISEFDVFIKNASLEFLFSHEKMIHLYYTKPDPVADQYFSQWTIAGYNPVKKKVLDMKKSLNQ